FISGEYRSRPRIRRIPPRPPLGRKPNAAEKGCAFIGGSPDLPESASGTQPPGAADRPEDSSTTLLRSLSNRPLGRCEDSTGIRDRRRRQRPTNPFLDGPLPSGAGAAVCSAAPHG